MLILGVLATLAFGQDVYQLTPDKLDKLVGRENLFVRFCRPDSGECRQSQMTFETLADLFEDEEDVLSFCELDCGQYAEYCAQIGVTLLPAYVAYTTGPEERQIYPEEKSDHNSLRLFILDVFHLPGARPAPVRRLTAATLSDFTNTPGATAFVGFGIYNCSVCHRQYAALTEAARAFANEGDFVFGWIDCVLYPDVCRTRNIASYPRVYMFRQTTRDAFPLPLMTGSEFRSFINTNFERTRGSDGLPDDTVGRVSELDRAARGFLEATDKEARMAACQRFPGIGNRYRLVMTRIVQDRSDAFVVEQIATLEDDLTERREQLTPAEQDEKKAMLNVLRQFHN